MSIVTSMTFTFCQGRNWDHKHIIRAALKLAFAAKHDVSLTVVNLVSTVELT